jgi:ribonuclease P protein component
MLQKSKRLNLKVSFNWVRDGQKTENDLFRIFSRFGENTEAKVGIALKKETFKLAVDRNRARRLTSKAFENIYNSLPSNLNIVVMPKAGVLKVSSDELTRYLKKELNI